MALSSSSRPRSGSPPSRVQRSGRRRQRLGPAAAARAEAADPTPTPTMQFEEIVSGDRSAIPCIRTLDRRHGTRRPTEEPPARPSVRRVAVARRSSRRLRRRPCSRIPSKRVPCARPTPAPSCRRFEAGRPGTEADSRRHAKDSGSGGLGAAAAATSGGEGSGQGFPHRRRQRDRSLYSAPAYPSERAPRNIRAVHHRLVIAGRRSCRGAEVRRKSGCDFVEPRGHRDRSHWKSARRVGPPPRQC